MKSRIIFLIVLALSFILGGVIKSYAAEAHAYASVLIIIPPQDEKAEANNVKEQDQEANLAQTQLNESDETKAD